MLSVWYVNLDRRPDRASMMEMTLSSNGYDRVRRIRAMDAKHYEYIGSIVDAAIQDGFDFFDVLDNYSRKHIMKYPGSLALQWTYCRALRDIKDLPLGTIVFLCEDDILLKCRHDVLSNAVLSLNDVKMICCTSHSKRFEDLSDIPNELLIQKSGLVFTTEFSGSGAYFQIFDPRGAAEMLDWIEDTPWLHLEKQFAHNLKISQTQDGYYGVADMDQFIDFGSGTHFWGSDIDCGVFQNGYQPS